MAEQTLTYDDERGYPLMLPQHEQAVILCIGDESYVQVIDHRPLVVDHWTLTQRAVWVARLRAIADQLEPGPEVRSDG